MLLGWFNGVVYRLSEYNLFCMLLLWAIPYFRLDVIGSSKPIEIRPIVGFSLSAQLCVNAGFLYMDMEI